MRKKRWFLGSVVPTIMAIAILAIAILVVSSFASTSAGDPKTSDTAVKIDNFTFQPQNVTVQAGATVTWTNRDDIPHTVVSNDGVFKSKVRDTDETFSYTFTKAGTYKYFCSLHPKMTGTVVVQ
jgi:amicyanin